MTDTQHHELRQLLKQFMVAIDTLNTNITALTTAIDNLPTPTAGGATEAQVQSAADAVAAQTARIVALETPPVVTPPAVPAA